MGAVVHNALTDPTLACHSIVTGYSIIWLNYTKKNKKTKLVAGRVEGAKFQENSKELQRLHRFELTVQ